MSEHDHRLIVEAESYDWAADITPVESVEKRLIRSLVGLTATTTLTSIKLTGWAFGTAKEATRQIVAAAAEAAAEAAESANVQSERRAENTNGDGSRTENLRAAMATRTNRKQSLEATLAALRARGDRLLDRSADVTDRDDLHPAYDRILDEIAPDEARILRLLATSGAQPSVDVRTARPFGVGSEMIEEGLSMIGELAGCRHLDRISAYLNNLHRLGLVAFSREPVEADRYQVVEVQPSVIEAVKRAGRSNRIVRRSILLTPFGDDFCHTCFSL
ncbi:Abi-alpha family protein [Rhodococcus erythropolis]|uniref:Abi-alpha family protein n=1 Tax=Rhodococcus erythropolis TaxID=1833 RepID=UPI00203556EF|nr:Abi-alpha family protein [Rhodococcus erythropolis]